MHSFKRYEEDVTEEIPSLIHTGSARVIRSHRRPPQFVVRPNGRRIVFALLVISISSTVALGTEGTSPGADVAMVTAVSNPWPSRQPETVGVWHSSFSSSPLAS
jgi:hypothetical protein